MKCKNCGKEINQEDINFCPYCGTSLKKENTTTFVKKSSCFVCGSEVPYNDVYYCPFCGTKINDLTLNNKFEKVSDKDLDKILDSLDSDFWIERRKAFVIKEFNENNLRTIFQFIKMIQHIYPNNKFIDNEIHYKCPITDEKLRKEFKIHNVSEMKQIAILVKFRNKLISRRELYKELYIDEYPVY